ncbi:Hint domain-containing protein [Pseudogemmobacter sonorensis]|uniref:Hint domain-containing protein n=1 Tax=Pseudogemmobacter sonorensis TaxID=2989681 RepID=UPI00369207A6
MLSDADGPLVPVMPEVLARALLVMEFLWPLPTDVLLHWHDPEGHALSLFHHPQSGLALMWRIGGRMTRHRLAPPLEADGRLARLSFGWSPQGWHMSLEGEAGAPIARAGGAERIALPARALARLCRGAGLVRRDPAVSWFGVAPGLAPPVRLPWIGRATPVPTPSGEVAADRLRPGDWVLTRNGGARRLRALRRIEMPSRGEHAAVILRAPYYARGRDILVSADQMVAIGGTETEYLFGEDEVLVAAGALVDGVSALHDNRRAVVPCLSLDLGPPCLVESAGCTWLSADHDPKPGLAPPLTALREYEARPLMELLRRMRPVGFAA